MKMVKQDNLATEASRLLGTSAPSYIRYDTEDDDSEAGYQPRSINPTIGRRHSLAASHPRVRSNSIVLYNEDEDDVVFTSYGPIVIEDVGRDTGAAPARGRLVLGWCLAVLSGILFTANNFFVKYFTIDAIEMLMVRSSLQTALMALVIVITKRKFLPEKSLDKVLVVLQGLFGGARILFQFACVQYMPIGDALTIVFTEPLWTLILSKLLLKVRIGAWKVAFGLLLIAGMVLCIQPPFLFPSQADAVCNSTGSSSSARNTSAEDLNTDEDEDSGYYMGVLLAIATAVTGSMANVTIAKCEKVSSKVMVFYSGLGGLLISLVCSSRDPANAILFSITAITGDTWLMLILLGLMGIIGYFSMTRSLRLIPPTTVAVLRALEIILAYIAQAVVMGEIPNIISISGSSLVMFSVVAFALEEIVLGKITSKHN